jgi:hypothetical protein
MTQDPSLWVKASASGGNGECVEMRRQQGIVEVRDTKQDGAGPTLRFRPREFAAWVEGARRGEFDDLV